MSSMWWDWHRQKKVSFDDGRGPELDKRTRDGPGKPIATALPPASVRPHRTCGAVWVERHGIRFDWTQFWKSHPLVVGGGVDRA